MTHKNTIARKLTVDINATHNLPSYNNVKLPYEVIAYVCSCEKEYIVMSDPDKDPLEYKCSECGNRVFNDANYYITNYASYELIEKSPFYDELFEGTSLEFDYD